MTLKKLKLLIENLEEELVPDFDIEKVNQHVYRFTIDKLVYQVEITESVTGENKNIIEIKFKLLNNPKIPKLSDFKTNQQYQIALRKSQVGVTGTGNPIKVFKKVIGSIIKTIADVSPEYITFTADETNRQSLYEKMIVIVSKYINTKYVRIMTNPLTGDETGGEEFWLKKSS